MLFRLSDEPANVPAAVAAIQAETERLGFSMASEPKTGALLRVLAATKPAGRFLELGTGTGLATAWLLDGMDAEARLTSVDRDADVMQVAQQHLGHDPRVSFWLGDGEAFLEQEQAPFDLIFADAWAGKFNHLDRALDLVKPGGIYFIDDLLPQPNWPDDHPPKVERLVKELERRADFTMVKLDWASGLMALVRRRQQL
jgi:predicted O-methyltransferase YrrM